MMDSLFKLFDDIISNFNCTKVETIGDAYFVVSGCPERIQNRKNRHNLIQDGANIAESFLPKNFGDIGTFGDMGTEITFC